MPIENKEVSSLNGNRKHLDQLSGQMEQIIRMKIYNLLIKSLDDEKLPPKLRNLINLAEVFQPGTKNKIKQLIQQDVLHRNKSAPSRTRGGANNGLL
jgi:hypothetical protein